MGLGSQPLTCKAVIESLEGTLGFLKPFGHWGPEGDSNPQAIEQATGMAKRRVQFPMAPCCTVSKAQ